VPRQGEEKERPAAGRRTVPDYAYEGAKGDAGARLAEIGKKGHHYNIDFELGRREMYLSKLLLLAIFGFFVHS
jgi:hypothetical protein